MTPANLAAIAAMTAATYATRVSGILIGDRLPQGGRARRALDALPAAVLTAVVAPAVISGRAEIIAGAITALVATRFPLLAALVAGMASVAVLRAFG